MLQVKTILEWMGIDIKKYKCMIYNEDMKKQNIH